MKAQSSPLGNACRWDWVGLPLSHPQLFVLKCVAKYSNIIRRCMSGIIKLWSVLWRCCMELTAIDVEIAVNSNSQSDRSRLAGNETTELSFPWLFVALMYTKETENHELDNNQSEGWWWTRQHRGHIFHRCYQTQRLRCLGYMMSSIPLGANLL